MENCITILWLKNWLYVPAFLIAVGFPNQTAWSITALTILMIVDVITGIFASVKIDGAKSITSRKMTAGVVAKAMILLIPFLFAVVGKGIGLNMDIYSRGFLSMLILAEFYSVAGNINSFRTGKRLPEIDVVSSILAKIRKTILNILERTKID
ncbi:MAG: phage holin family protein [Candidatus Moraniibacteriota bacterium]